MKNTRNRMMKREKFNELVPKLVSRFTPFRSDPEIKIDQIHFRKKGEDEWSYFSKIFSCEDDYNHKIKTNDENKENLIV